MTIQCWKVLFLDEVEEHESQRILSQVLQILPVKIDVQFRVLSNAANALDFLREARNQVDLLMLKSNLHKSRSVHGEGLFCPQEFVCEVRKLNKTMKIILMSPEKPRVPVALRNSKDILSILRCPFSCQTLRLAVMGSFPLQIWSTTSPSHATATVLSSPAISPKKMHRRKRKHIEIQPSNLEVMPLHPQFTVLPSLGMVTPIIDEIRIKKRYQSEIITDPSIFSIVTPSSAITESSTPSTCLSSPPHLQPTTIFLNSLHNTDEYTREIEEIIKAASTYLFSPSPHAPNSPVLDMHVLEMFKSASIPSSPTNISVIRAVPPLSSLLSSPVNLPSQSKNTNILTPTKINANQSNTSPISTTPVRRDSNKYNELFTVEELEQVVGIFTHEDWGDDACTNNLQYSATKNYKDINKANENSANPQSYLNHQHITTLPYTNYYV